MFEKLAPCDTARLMRRVETSQASTPTPLPQECEVTEPASEGFLDRVLDFFEEAPAVVRSTATRG